MTEIDNGVTTRCRTLSSPVFPRLPDAIFGGFAMVLTLMLPARSLYKLQVHWDRIDVICTRLPAVLIGSFPLYAFYRMKNKPFNT
jgi:hypothetical protein